MKKTSTLVILFLCTILMAIPRIKFAKTQTKTIVVPDDFSNIIDAINHATDGNKIFLKSGVYEIWENQKVGPAIVGIEINKTLSIIGEDPTNTIIVFPPDNRTGFPLLFSRKYGFRINADLFGIANLTILNCDYGISLKGNEAKVNNIFTSSIVIVGNYCDVIRNSKIVSDSYQFPFYIEGSFNNIVQNNYFTIECEGSFNNLTENSERIGINGDFNLITNQKLDELTLVTSDFNQIYNNSMGYLSISESNNNTIGGNKIEGGGYLCGLTLASGSDNIFYANLIANFNYNDQYYGMRLGIVDSLVENNIFYYNNFVNNSKHVVAPTVMPGSGNFFDNGIEGNYWDNYVGIDNDKDGIGDTPYIIRENNQDNYPLINPIDIEVIPEFSPWTILPICFVSTLVIILIRKKWIRCE